MSATIPGSTFELEEQTPPAPLTPKPAKQTRERLLSLDVFRGLTVAGMLLVNDPGSWAAIYPPLEHAAWHGWTPTDLIFPFFLFIAGVTTCLSLDSRRARGDDDVAIRRQIIRRGADLGVDYALTHSCYDPTPGGLACGRCDSCLLRKKGFAEAGLPDPTRYAGIG